MNQKVPSGPAGWARHPVARLLREYAWPHRVPFFFGGLCVLATNYLSVSIPVEVGDTVDTLREGGSVVWHVVLVALMGALIIPVRTLSRVLVFNPGRDVEYQLRSNLFATLMSHQPSFFVQHSTGDIVSRASNDITFARAMVGFGLLQVVNVSVAVVMTGWQMIHLSPTLTFLALGPVFLGLMGVQVAIGWIFRLHRQAQQQLGVLSDQVLESFQGIATIQGFVAHEAFSRRFAERNEALFRTRLKATWIGATAFPGLMVCGSLGVGVLLWFGGNMVVVGSVMVGELVAFSPLLAVLLPPLRSLGGMLSVFQRGIASLERIFEMLDTPLDRPEGLKPKRLLPEGGGQAPTIEVRDLSWAYPEAPDRRVLDGVSFVIPPGSTVGVFGRTGSGKSTLLHLLVRLINPPLGTVRLQQEDGQGGLEIVDLTEVSLNAWRERVAMATQRPFLFSDTIAENVALECSPDRKRVEWAVSKAALDADLKVLPDGLETVVGERGIMLSGGQRQRVALARALYRPGDIVILDDVLSAVDHQTEVMLLETIENLGKTNKGRPTVFIASHRLSAIQRADVILVLDDGKLVHQGTHEELIAIPGHYQDTWHIQQAAE